MATLPQSNSDISANAFEGKGGTVTINAQGVIGFSPRSRDNLIQALGTSTPTELNARDLQSNDITAISQATPGLSGEILITTHSEPSRTEELPSRLTDASEQIKPTVCRATQGSEFWVTGQGGVLPSPREPFWSEDVWEDWRLMAIAETPSEAPLLSSTAEQAEGVSEIGAEVAMRAQHRHVNAPHPPNALPPHPPNALPPQLLEAQDWHITINGDIILVADAPSTAIHPSLSSTISLPVPCHS